MNYKNMDSNLVVLETPELQKTIEEINDEIEPKIFTHYLGIENKPRELSLPEIYDVLNADTKKKAQFEYISTKPKSTHSKELKIKAIEAELLSIQKTLNESQQNDPNYSRFYLETVELEKRLEKIKDKSLIVSKKHVFPKSGSISSLNFADSFNENVSYELSLTDIEEKTKFSRLENKVRELEYVLGAWKQPRPVAEVLSEFLFKTKFLNFDLLERIKDQAGHLATDLDIIISTETQSNSYETIDKIAGLHKDTFTALSNLPKLSLYLERLQNSVSFFTSHSVLAKMLLNLEVSSENILGRSSQSLLALETLQQNLGENYENIRKNLKIQKKTSNN